MFRVTRDLVSSLVLGLILVVSLRAVLAEGFENGSVIDVD